MIYVYPKFSKNEIPGIRFGGPGLGNLLFIYSRALVFAHEHKYKLIWPTWPSLKIGPWIRHEKDKRFYGDLFCNNINAVDGINKEKLLLFSHKIPVSEWNAQEQYPDKTVIEYDFFKMSFDELKNYHKLIRNNIIRILKPKSKQYRRDDFHETINVHIRLGDFSKSSDRLSNGANNTRIDIGWYKNIILKVRDCIGTDIKVNIFSDGSEEELQEVVSLPNVERKFYGNSIADIMALSESPLMIASGSSFSLWARFLGQGCSISFPGQIKDHVLIRNNEKFEIELAENEQIPQEVKTTIKRMYKIK